MRRAAFAAAPAPHNGAADADAGAATDMIDDAALRSRACGAAEPVLVDWGQTRRALPFFLPALSTRARRLVGLVDAADDAVELLLVHARVARAGVVAVEDLGRDLDLGVLGHHLRRDLGSTISMVMTMALYLHVAHADEVVALHRHRR